MQPGLGRLHVSDDRDRLFLAAPLLAPPEAPKPKWRYWWNLGARLNQGQTSTCVAHAWVHLAENSPVTRPGTLDPIAIYQRATEIDEWVDNDGDLNFGTSVRAGAKAMAELSVISEYRWAWDLQTAVEWLLTKGPLVIGVDWYSEMMRPTYDGFIWPAGSLVGGHAVVLDGVNTVNRFVRGLNSWGPDWGNKGTFRLTFEALEALIVADGEVCMAAEIAA